MENLDLKKKEAEARLLLLSMEDAKKVNAVNKIPGVEQAPDGPLELIGETLSGGVRTRTSSLGNLEGVPELLDFDSKLVSALGNEYGNMDAVNAKLGSVISLSPENAVKNVLASFPGTTADVDQYGTVKFTTPKGTEFLLNAPGFTSSDLLQLTTQGGLFAGAAGGVAKALPQGANLLARMGAQGLGQGLTAAGMDVGSDLISGRSPDVDALPVGLSGLFGTLFPGSSALANKARFGRLTNVPDPQYAGAAVEQAERVAAQTGVKVPAGQALDDPAAGAFFKELQRIPATARRARDFFTKMDERISASVERFISETASPEEISKAAFNIRRNAQQGLKKIKEEVKAINKANFTEALKPKRINVTGVRANILAGTERSGPEVKKFVNNWLNRMVRSAGGKDNINKLHEFRQTLDDQIGLLQRNGKNNQARILINLKNQLTEEMSNAVPAYGQAVKEAEKNFALIAEFEASPLGRLAGITDDQLDTIGQKIFGPSSTPRTVARTREQIEALDPAAWRGIVGDELERRLASVRGAVPGSEFAPNSPKLMSQAIFGKTEGEFLKFQAALPKEGAANARFIKEMLDVTARFRREGGSTATATEGMDFARRGFVARIWETIASTTRSLGGPQTRAAQGRRANKLFDLFFDPDVSKLVTQARTLAQEGKWSDATGVWTQIITILNEQDINVDRVNEGIQ